MPHGNIETADEWESDNTNEFVELFDVPFLERQTLGRKDLMQEILKLFQGQLEIHREALKTSETPEELKIRAHTIKGAAHGVGANGLAEAAKRVEKPLLAGQPAPACSIYFLRSKLDQTYAFVSGLLSH